MATRFPRCWTSQMRQLGLWRLQLSGFKLDAVHCVGVEIQAADTLSGIPAVEQYISEINNAVQVLTAVPVDNERKTREMRRRSMKHTRLGARCNCGKTSSGLCDCHCTNFSDGIHHGRVPSREVPWPTLWAIGVKSWHTRFWLFLNSQWMFDITLLPWMGKYRNSFWDFYRRTIHTPIITCE